MGQKGGLFRYADNGDKVLMAVGGLGSVGDGLMTPLTMMILSGLINEYGSVEASFSNHIVDKYSLMLVYLAIGVGISAFIEGVCWTRTGERQTSKMRTEYLRSVLRQEVSFFDNQSSSSNTFQVVSTVSSDAHLIQDAIAEKIPNLVANLSSFLVCIPLAFVLSWRLAVAALPFSLMFIIPGVGFGKVLKDLGAKNKDAYGVAGSIAEQAVSSIRTVYSYVGESQSVDNFSRALAKCAKLGTRQGLVKGLLMGSMGMIYAAWAFQAWVGSFLVADRREKGGGIFIAGICVILGGLSVMHALPNLSFISEAMIASSRIASMTDRVPLIDSDGGKGRVLKKVRGNIEFREVDFSYPSRPDTPILRGFSLRVKAGTMVGLVGTSGSGKSTIISLLERFYDPVRGEVLFDGNNLKKLELKWLRSQMGFVNQEPILFATSIKENILFGKKEASMDDVVQAAKSANAHGFIAKLPLGYDTHVGQYGVQLSGGQKQRIAIARALIRDPKILLLDEATSALDPQSERVVQEALDKASLGRTTIVIAHRLSTIRNSNLIAVLGLGQVLECGSHNDLVQKSGAYRNMLELQQQQPNSSGHPMEVERNNRSAMVSRRFSSSPSPIPSSQNSPSIFSMSIASSFQVIGQSHETTDTFESSPSSPSPSQWRLLRMSLPEWKQASLGCLGAAVFGSIPPIHAYCLGTVVSVYFVKDTSQMKSQIYTYCYIFLTLAGISLVANLVQHYNFGVMGESLTKRVRQKVLEQALTFEIGWFDRDENSSAAVCSRLATDASMVRSLICDRTSLLIQVFFSATLAFTLALIVTWSVGIVMIAIQPLLIGSFYSRSVLMKNMSIKAKKAQAEGSQLASEAATNHRTITAFSSQERILDLFRLAMKGPERENIKQSWLLGTGLFASQFFTTAAIALTFWYGGRLMNKGQVSSKSLFQAFFILMSTGKNIADAGSMTSDLARGAGAIKSIFEILDRKTEIEPENPDGLKKAIKGKIELKNVSFAYPMRPEQMIFNGLSLKIRSGETVALVGQSGSGKSTVIGLIERFYDPLSGSVLIDDNDIRHYDLRKLRSQIALVSQEPTLFGGTIRDNIVYGKEKASEAEMRKAAKLANAHDFISSMKEGYDTYCGERGSQLSGGQKQRIALARAILKDPKILLLDEATSALDSASEILVQEALERMMVGRTCVVVAHRLLTIQKADSIAVIKNGKVAEQGSHNELVANGRHGVYYNLVRMQNHS